VPAVRYTVRARHDLIDIWQEVSEVDPAAADDLYNRLEARVEILRRFRDQARSGRK
jgi:plasmid stabilization system protein ParE